MNTIKAFLKERGLYLFCLALVFAATATGILAIRNVVRNVADLTEARRNAIEEGSTWNQPDALANEPVTDLPEEEAPAQAASSQPTAQPSAASSPAPSSSPVSSPATAAPDASAGSAASSVPSAASHSAPLDGAEISMPYSGEELVYHATLGDWRTHNGADYTGTAGATVYAVQPGTVAAVYDDALWGGVVEVSDGSGRVWKYCGLRDVTLARGDSVPAGAALGSLDTVPAEADSGAHLHLECSRDGVCLDPAA